MLNVHSVSEVNILRDSSGVLRVIIGCQDPCITKKNKKKTSNCGQNAASDFCDVDGCDGNRPLTVPTGSLADGLQVKMIWFLQIWKSSTHAHIAV